MPPRIDHPGRRVGNRTRLFPLALTPDSRGLPLEGPGNLASPAGGRFL